MHKYFIVQIYGNHLRSLAEKVFFITSFIFFSEAFVPLIKDVSQLPLLQHLSSNQLQLFLNLPIFIGNILLFIGNLAKVRLLITKERLLWWFLAVALISILWCNVPTVTLRNVFVLSNATLLGIYFAACYSWKQQLQLLAWAFGIITVLSVLFIIFLPHYGVMGLDRFISTKAEEMQHTDSWRGIYVHKNHLGLMMSLSGLVFFFLAKSKDTTFNVKVFDSSKFALPSAKKTIFNSWIALVVFSLACVLIVGSDSVSSLVFLLVPITFWLLYRIWCWIYTLGVPFLMGSYFITGGLTVLLIIYLEKILAIVNKDFTLSTRTRLWVILWDNIWELPWLGYGYGGFWQVTDASKEIQRTIGAFHGHNGFLDLWLDLGLLGLSVFIGSFISAWFLAITYFKQTRTIQASWSIAYLLFFLLANISESSLLGQKALWLLYVAVVLSISKELLTTVRLP